MNIGLSMRKYHRWISTIGVVIIFYLSVTGLLVVYTQIGNPETTRPIAETLRPASAPMPAGNPLGEAATIRQMIRTVLNAAQQSWPAANASSLRLQLMQQDGAPVGVVTLQSDTTQRLAFDASTGAAVTVPESVPENMNGPFGGMGGPNGMNMGMEMGMGMPMNMGANPAGGPGGQGMGGEPQGNFLLRNAQGIHSGAYFGSIPQWIILITGMGMVVLSLTGIWIYVDMLARRRKNGRTGWFWE